MPLVQAGQKQVSPPALDVLALLEHRSGLFGTEQFLGFVGSKEGQYLVNAADAFLEGSNEFLSLLFFIGFADSSQIPSGNILQAVVSARRIDNTLYML